jgi:hypothetical protein
MKVGSKTYRSIRNLLLFSCLGVLVSGCPFGYGYKYHTGIFPENPVNLEVFNSEFDDYNATAPTLGQTLPLCYSTNRGSYGADFDFIYKIMSIEFSKSDGMLDVYENTNGNLDVVIRNSGIGRALGTVNTDGNEFGPFLVSLGTNYEAGGDLGYEEMYMLLYSTDNGESQDIMYSHNLDTIPYSPPAEVAFLNSPYDDQYPCLESGDSIIYFTSNRAGVFNIYQVEIDPDVPLTELIEDTLRKEIQLVETVSSASDDKCPYVTEGHLVFASNREGGFGGYDLYYSKRVNGSWSDPVNCGVKVNSEFDEFRPLLLPHFDFSNDFLLFSSNRPGGMGGFDLWYVGVDFVKSSK